MMKSIAFTGSIITSGIALFLALGVLISDRSRNLADQFRLGLISTIVMGLGLLALTISIIIRAIQTGHGPFSNMYEFFIAFAWGILLMGLIFYWRYTVPR
jgi:ABC-type transport system involved in cytochrome c biogenesis permease subunit